MNPKQTTPPDVAATDPVMPPAAEQPATPKAPASRPWVQALIANLNRNMADPTKTDAG